MSTKKTWLKRNIKWLVPVTSVLVLTVYLISSSGMGKVTTDLAQAYADKALYENAIEKANASDEVLKMMGKIEPIDKMTIINGEVNFSENNQQVTTTIKVEGAKGNGKMDILAYRENESWQYERINIRIEDSEGNKTIEIINNQ